MRFIRLLVGLAGIALLGGVILGYGGPLVYDLDLLAHFRLHLLGLSGIVAVFALLTGERATLWRAVAAAVLAIAGLSPIWEGPGPEGTGTPLTVMVANLYIHNERPEAMRQALVAAGADVLVTAETSPDALEGSFGLDRYYPHRLLFPGRTSNLRIVLWSRFPILEGELLFTYRNRAPSAATALVEIAPGQVVSVLALHLAHVGLGPQQNQVARLDEIVADLPRPLIVMGDFNATAWSWAVHRIERLTGTRRIGGVIRTWNGSYPTPLGAIQEPFGLPIDHILVSPGVGVAGIGTVEIPGSDHSGVRAMLRIPDGAGSSAPGRPPVSR